MQKKVHLQVQSCFGFFLVRVEEIWKKYKLPSMHRFQLKTAKGVERSTSWNYKDCLEGMW